jgi:hypothetical protein
MTRRAILVITLLSLYWLPSWVIDYGSGRYEAIS